MPSAWLRLIRQLSSRGSRYFSASHFSRIAGPPSLDRLNTTRRSFTLLTSCSGGSVTSATSAVRYVYRIISSRNEMILYTYRTADVADVTLPPLQEVSSVKLRRVVFNLSKLGGPAMRLKWLAEKYLEPRLESCLISRSQALGIAEGCFVSRNEPMHDSVSYLKNNLKDETDILHEYYIPRDRFVPFVD